MLIGTIEVKGGYLHTNKKSYALRPGTHFFVRLPFIAPAVSIAGFLIGFSLVFGNLMSPVELAIFWGISVTAVAAGVGAARLELINRDLHRAETSTITWGTVRHLNAVRWDLSTKLDVSNNGGMDQ